MVTTEIIEEEVIPEAVDEVEAQIVIVIIIIDPHRMDKISYQVITITALCRKTGKI